MTLFPYYIVLPIINVLLLALNFILAPHKPYKEKKTPFECGYHSFLQNRSQFTISFYLFGLLFLIFDIELVVVFPISVSSYFNAAFGVSVVVMFVLVLALGFVFELGKGALKIDSKQGRVPLQSSLLAAFPPTYIVKFFTYKTQLNMQIIYRSKRALGAVLFLRNTLHFCVHKMCKIFKLKLPTWLGE